jgi:predicted N-acyltransferase
VTAPTVEQWDSVACVGRDPWDALAGTRVLHSWGWLRTLEESSTTGARHLYFVARGNSGLLGAIVARVQDRGQAGSTADNFLFNRGAALAGRLRAGVLPALVCGAQMGHASPMLLRSGLSAAERDVVRRALLAAVDQIASANGWSVLFRELPRRGSQLAAELATRGHLRTPELPVACLPIAWTSFGGYLAHLGPAHRWMARNVRRELRAARRHGLVVEAVADPGPAARRLHDLLDAHQRRLNDLPFPFDVCFLSRLRSHLGERALIYVARIAGGIAGVAVGVAGGTAVHMLKVGIDPVAGREAGVLANLCYNRPIEDATAAGRERIYYGRLLYGYKARRGCALIDADAFLRCHGRLHQHLLRPALDLRARRMAARTAGLPRLPDAAEGAADGV